MCGSINRRSICMCHHIILATGISIAIDMRHVINRYILYVRIGTTMFIRHTITIIQIVVTILVIRIGAMIPIITMMIIGKDVMTHMIINTRKDAVIEKDTNMMTIIEVNVTRVIMAERTAIEITEGIKSHVS